MTPHVYQSLPPDEWLAPSDEIRREPPPIPTLEDAFRLAESLEPEDRQRLIARLWIALPPVHRTALIQLQLEEIQQPSLDGAAPQIGHSLWESLFDPANTTELYSAPRRFDLATIFVVTAAYSLLFGGLTALDAGPLVKIIFGLLVTLVAVGQALLLNVANPRGVSIVVGAAAYTIISLVLWSIYPRVFPNSFLLVAVINGLIGGAVMGYIAGVLVGGVFLAADALRGKFDRGAKLTAEQPSDESET